MPKANNAQLRGISAAETHEALNVRPCSIQATLPQVERETILAIRSGLPTHDDVTHLMSAIKSQRQIVIEQQDTLITVPLGTEVSFTADDHTLLVSDIREDFRAANTLLNKLRVAIASLVMRGAYRENLIEHPQNDVQSNPVSIKLHALESLLHELHNAPTIPLEYQEIILTHYNNLVPGELRLSTRGELTPRVVQMLLDTCYEMRTKAEPDRDDSRCVAALQRIQKLSERLYQVERAPLLALGQDGEVTCHHEYTLHLFRKEHRELIREVAGILENGNWCSPGYGESGIAQRGVSQTSEPFKSDYQRWFYEELRSVEQCAQGVVFRPRKMTEQMHSMLLPSAMSAYQVVFQVIAAMTKVSGNDMEECASPTILLPHKPYVEVHNALSDFCITSGCTGIGYRPQDIRQLEESIINYCPTAIFVEPVGNNFEMQVVSVRKILRAIVEAQQEIFKAERGYDNHRVLVVIDSTLLGRAARWKELDFSSLPSWLSIVNIESLIKFGELGQDLVPAALVTTIGDNIRLPIDRVRLRGGFVPPETTVRRLYLLLDETEMTRRLKRHSRNTQVLLDVLSSRPKESGYLFHAIHPLVESKTSARAYEREATMAGARCSLGVSMTKVRELLKRPARAEDEQELLTTILSSAKTLILQLAADAKLNVIEGTSFGFDYTRIAIYTEPSSSKFPKISQASEERAYLRIAPGQENMKDIKIFAAILVRVEEILIAAIGNENWYGQEVALGKRGKTYPS